MVDVSEAAVLNATGEGWDHWFAIQDGYPALDHAARVKRLLEESGDAVSHWWAQSIVVEWERSRGVRVEGQSCKGDFQVSCSKTMPGTAADCFAAVVATPFLGPAHWSEGAAWEHDGARIEVRRVDPGKMLRWFWQENGTQSTVAVDFWPGSAGKTQVRFGHSGLQSLEERERFRSLWKTALDAIAATQS